jgi:tRNA pseudouridine38-40 synthase
MRIVLGIEYCGSAFSGWQYLGAERAVRTVQGSLQQALTLVAAEPVQVVCAGRTDSGVHACGQVVHFDTSARRSERAWILGANSRLPPDVSVTWARAIGDDFHARYSATGRRYRYIILNSTARSGVLAGRVTWHYWPLDCDRMQAAADALIGEHDFSAFRSSECQSKSTVRHLRQLRVRRDGEFVVLDAEANAFLHHMVRNLVGVLLAIGAGRQEIDWARRVLQSRDRRLGGVTAPADGLYLYRVDFPAHFGIPDPRGAFLPVPPA